MNKRIVLVGYLGHGKTTLFNKICKKDIKVHYGGESSTRQAYLSTSSYGLGFELLDTPGLGSFEDKLAHVVGLYSALIEGPVHQILMVIKYERIQIMQSSLRQMLLKQFNRFRDIVTVAVTFWDMVEEQHKIQNQEKIIQFLKSVNVTRVMFISKNDSGQTICNMVDAILLKSLEEDDIFLNQLGLTEEQKQKYEERKKRQITITEMSSYFDVITLEDDVVTKLADAQGCVTSQFRKKQLAIEKFIKEFPIENDIMPEVMHQLCLQIDNIAKQTIEEFQIKQVNLINEIQASTSQECIVYYIDAQLKSAIAADIRYLKELTQKKMSKSNTHFFNFIKKCPQCGLIWIKVYGCNLDTYCGRVPENEDKQFIESKQPKKFEIKINENYVEYFEYPTISTATEKYGQTSEYKGKIGCGNKFIWKDLPPLDENQLRELLDPEILSYLSGQELEKQEKHNVLEKEVKKQIEQMMKAQKIQYI